MFHVLAFFVGAKYLTLIAKIFYIGVAISFLVAIGLMWGGFVTMFFYFYGIADTLIINVFSSSNSDYVNYVFGFLNCIGFVDAFNNTKEVWLSSLSFLAGRIMFSQSINLYKMYLHMITPLLT